MPYFEADEQTKAIVIYTEPGGRMEAQLAEWVKDNDTRLPIVAFMAGKFMDDEEMKGMSFGHAGHDRRGRRGHRDREDRPPRSRRHPRRRADRRDPRRGQGEARGARLMAEQLNKVFIDVEVDELGRERRRARRQARRSLPRRHLQGRRRPASRSSRRTSTSASSASSASKPRPRAPSTSGSSTTAPSSSLAPRRYFAASGWATQLLPTSTGAGDRALHLGATSTAIAARDQHCGSGR